MSVFADIYARNAWNGVESLSGPGSGLSPTARVARDLVELVGELGVTSVLDAACGDSVWMPALPGYVGMDVVPEAIERSRKRHSDRRYEVGDVRLSLPGAFGLVILRDAMQHMPLTSGVAALGAITASDSAWLLASTYIGGRNVRIPEGAYFEPDLMAPPFDLGAPVRLIPDGYSYDGSPRIRDPRKFLGLWPL